MLCLIREQSLVKCGRRAPGDVFITKWWVDKSQLLIEWHCHEILSNVSEYVYLGGPIQFYKKDSILCNAFK